MPTTISEEDAVKAATLASQFRNNPKTISENRDAFIKTRDILTAYEAQQTSAGRPLFEQSRRQRIQEEQTFRLKFQDRESYGMDPEQKREFDNRFQFDPSSKKAVFVSEFFERELGLESRDATKRLDTLIPAYSENIFGERVEDVETFYKMVGDGYNRSDEIDNLAQDAAMKWDSPLEGFANLSPEVKTAEMFQSTAGWKQFETTHRNTSARLSSYRGMIGWTAEQLGAITGANDEKVASTYRQIAEMLVDVPGQDLNLVLAAISANAPEGDDKAYVKKLFERIGRGSQNLVFGSINRPSLNSLQQAESMAMGITQKPVGMTLSEYVAQELGRALSSSASGMASGTSDLFRSIEMEPVTDEMRSEMLNELDRASRAIELHDKLRIIANNDIDPATGEGMVTNGLLNAAESIPYTFASLAGPAGFIITSNALAQDSYQRLSEADPTLTRQQKLFVTNLAAPIQAGLERISGRLMTGNLKSLNRFYNQATITNGAAARRFATRLLGTILVEEIQENFQDATPFVVQGVISALSEDMPGVDWEARFGEVANWEYQGELFFSILPLSLIGAGGGTISDFRDGRSLISDRLLLETELNGNKDAAAEIKELADAGDLAGAQSKLREAFRESGSDQKNVSQVKGEAQIKLMEQAVRMTEVYDNVKEMGLLPVIGKTDDGWTVTPSEGQSVTFATHSEAMDAVQSYTNDKNIKLTEEVWNALRSTSRNFEVGETRQIQMSPFAPTVEEQVEAGQISQEKADERESQGRREEAKGEEQEQSAEEAAAELDEEYQRTVAEDSLNSPGDVEVNKARMVILGSNEVEFKGKIAKALITLNRDYVPFTVIEEMTETDAKKMIKNGQSATLVGWLRSYEKLSGEALFDESKSNEDLSVGDIVEAWSDMTVSYAQYADTKMGENVIGGNHQAFIRKVLNSPVGSVLSSYMRMFRAILRRADRIGKLREEGKLDPNFERALQKSLGISEQDVYNGEVVEEARGLRDDLARQLGGNPDGSFSAISPAKILENEVKGMTADEVRDFLKNTKLTPTRDMVAMLGSFPEYLNPVIDYILEKRQDLLDGKTSPRDVAKAYWITIASIGADAIDVSTIKAQAENYGIEFDPDPLYMAVGKRGQQQMRPEELAAYWLGTQDGQKALDNIEKGIFRKPDWESGLLLRDAFGRNDLRSKKQPTKKNPEGTYKSGAVGIPKKNAFNLRNLKDAVEAIQDAKGKPDELEVALKKIVGIGEGKKGFIGHLLGFGEWATLDAVELNMWLTGEGETTYASKANKKRAAVAKRASGSKKESEDLFRRIRKRINNLRKTAKGGLKIPEEVAAHVIHHWIWDAGKGLETTHEGVYHSMRTHSVVTVNAAFDDAPVISLDELVGKDVFPIIADLTAAGGVYRGIDSSELAVPIKKFGGPKFPFIKEFAEKGIAWASQGKSVVKQKQKRTAQKAYGVVVSMMQNSHVSNSSLTQAIIETTLAYVRDGRIKAGDVAKLNDLIKGRDGLQDFPGLNSPDVEKFVSPDRLSFEKRTDIATTLQLKQATEYGLPSVTQIVEEWRERDYDGLNWGDSLLVIEFDSTSTPVRLGEDGNPAHPSYSTGLKGKVVGKFEKPINYQMIWEDFFKKRRAQNSPEQGDRRAFDLSKPVQTITKEIAGRVSSTPLNAIKTPAQARAVEAFIKDDWRTTNTAKNKGGLGPAEFVDALNSNPAKVALDEYDLKEFKNAKKEKGLEVFQLGKEKIFFGVKDGDPASGYGFDPEKYGFSEKEKTLTLVLNGERGTKGILPAVMLKALREGVTALDAYAVKSKRFPDGFLPLMYSQFGFEVTGTIPFDESFYDKNKLADLRKLWQDNGWDESLGNPDIVLMKWKGNDEDRSGITQRYLEEGSASFLSAGTATNDAAAGRDIVQSHRRGDEAERSGPDGRGNRGIQGDAVRPPDYTGGLAQAVNELESLSQNDRKNLGLPTSDSSASFSVISDPAGTIEGMFSPFNATPELRLKMVEEMKHRGAEQAQKWQRIIEQNRTLKSLNREAQVREGLEYDRLLRETFGADTTEKQDALPPVDRQAARSEAKKVAEDWKKKTKQSISNIDRKILIGGLRTLEAITSALPAEVRGKIGGSVKLAQLKKPEAMIDEIERRTKAIDRELERYLKNEANEEIEKLFTKIANSREKGAGKTAKGKNLPEIYVIADKIREVQKGWSTEEGAAESEKIHGLIESNAIADEDLFLQEKLAELIPLFSGWNGRTKNVEVPGQKKKKRIRIAEAAGSAQRFAAFKSLSELWNQGKEQWKMDKALEKERRDILREVAIGDIKKHNKKSRTRDEQDELDKSRKSLPRNFAYNSMSFDGVLQWFFGEDSQIYKWATDSQRKAENEYTDRIREIGDQVDALFTELGGSRLKGKRLRFKMAQKEHTFQPPVGERRKLSQLEMIQALLMWQQEDGKRHMEGRKDDNGKVVSDWGYDQKFIDEVRATLSEEGFAVFEWLADFYANEYNRINKVYKKIFGVDMPRHINYAPLTVQQDMTLNEAVDPLTNFFSGGMSGVSGSFKTRGNATVEPKFNDGLKTFLAHQMQMEHFIAFAEFSRELKAITGKAEVRAELKRSGGEDAVKTLGNWVEDIDQGGIRKAGGYMAINNTLNRMGGRLAQAILFAKVQTILLNATQLGAAAVVMTPAEYTTQMSKLFTGKLDWFEALNTPYIKRRIEEMPPIIRQALDSQEVVMPSRLTEFSEKTGFGISASDGFFTAGTYVMVLDQQRRIGKKAGKTGKELEDWARNETERIVDRLAQPTRRGARSAYENILQDGAWKTLFNFGSESRKNLGLVMHAAVKGDVKTKAGTAFYVLIANALFAEILRTGWRDLLNDEESEDDWDVSVIALNAVLDPLYGVPIFGAMAQDAVKSAAGQRTMSGTVLDTGQNAIPAIKRMKELDYNAEEFDKFVTDMNRALGGAAMLDQRAASLKSIGNILEQAAKLANNLID